MKNAVLACLVALVFAAGCEQKKDDAPAAPPTPPKPAAELPRPPVGIAPPVEEKAAAEADGKKELVTRIDKLVEKENARHQRVMDRLKEKGSGGAP